MGKPDPHRATSPADRAGAAAFGAYVRFLRENVDGPGRGKSLRRLARDSGIAPSVLSRGERGLQDLRRADYLERIAPHLGVRSAVMKRVAATLTREDLETVTSTREGSTSQVLWTRLSREIERLRGATPQTLEAVLAYIEFLTTRQRATSERR